MMLKRSNSLIRVMLGTFISALFVWLILRHIRVYELWTLLQNTRRVPVGIAVVSLAVAVFLRAIRWWVILKCAGVSVALKNVMQVLLAGSAMNYVLPFRAGDVMRVTMFSTNLGCSRTTLLGSLILEKALDLLAIMLIGLGVLSIRSIALPHASARYGLFGFLMAGTLCLLALFLFSDALERLGKQVTTRLSGKPNLQSRIDRLFSSILHVFGEVGFSFGAALGILSVISWLIEGIVYVSCARAVISRGIDPLAPWLVLVLANLSMVLPSSPGYVGTFHAAAVTGMVAYGSSAESAAAFAVLTHLVLWLPVTVVGLGCFWVLRPYRALLKASESRAASAAWQGQYKDTVEPVADEG